MCGWGGRRAGEREAGRSAKEEDGWDGRVRYEKSWPPFPSGYGEEVKKRCCNRDLGPKVVTEWLCSLPDQSKNPLFPSILSSKPSTYGQASSPGSSQIKPFQDPPFGTIHSDVMMLLGKESVIRLSGFPHPSTCLCSHPTP